MIIDTHTHFYDPFRPEGVPWPPPDHPFLYRRVLPADLKALPGTEEVTGTVVVEASSWLEDNPWILELAADEPWIVGFVGQLPVGQPDFHQHLTRLAADPLFRGIRCGGDRFLQNHPKDFLTDLKALAERNLTLDVLIRAEHLDAVLAVAHQIPELRIVINHILHMPVDGEPIRAEWQARMERAASVPNLYMKVSAVMEQSTQSPAPLELDFYRPALDLLWETFGTHRVLYGSNWPVSDRSGRTYADYLNMVTAYFAEKGEAATANYFWRNASTVYQWVQR